MSMSENITELKNKIDKALKQMKSFEFNKAIRTFRSILKEYPHFVEIYIKLGNCYKNNKKNKEEIVCYQRAIKIKPNYVLAHYGLGLAKKALNKTEESINHFHDCIKYNPKYAPAYFSLGIASFIKGKHEEEIKYYLQAIELRPAYAMAHFYLACAYKLSGKFDLALYHCKKAIEHGYNTRDVQLLLGRLYSYKVPTWHFSMMNDLNRNQAFEESINKHITKESIVLDIGTGSGLLAMMAARAGAKQVYACEMVDIIADTAKKIIEKNKLSHKITILNKKSTEIEIGKDMPEKADLLVTEIFDTALLGESVLPTLAHAKKYLIKEQGRIIPYKAKIFAQLIESKDLFREHQVTDSFGFDLSLFNKLADIGYFQKNLNNYKINRLSRPILLFKFDFNKHFDMENKVHFKLKTQKSGVLHAIVLWFTLCLDQKISYSTSPYQTNTHWGQAVFIVDPARKVNEGELLELHAEYQENKIYVEISNPKT
jgi:tetratricopeptide (TPR) repeat protein